MLRSRNHRSTRFNLLCLEQRLAPAVVTNINDSGAGSLRAAVASTNASSSDDVITFDSAYFGVPRTITLAGGQLNISDSVHIQGPGANLLTVSGGSVSRVFNVNGAGTPQVILSGLRIANGKVAGAGAGIYNQGEFLSLINCTLSNNVATGASGGGVSSVGGTLMLSNCTVTGNSAGSNGGGVDANSGAAVTIGTSTIAGNIAASQGGGIGVGSSSLVVDRSTVSGNIATGSGGGMYFAGTATSAGVTLRTSTFSGNTSGLNGGAVHLSNFGGTLVVQSCTLTSNSAKNAGGAIYQASGGSGAITVESTILSGNNASFYADAYNSAHPATVRFSALGSKSGFTFSDLGGNLPVGADLKLGTMTSNGGFSKTHSLLPGSPAIDAGSNPAAALYDQRGSGFPRVVNGRADIGAFESQYLVVTNANDSGPGSLRQTVADANAITSIDAVTFDPAFFATPRTITLASGEITISDAIVIHGPGAGFANVRGNSASRIFRVDGPGTVAATINSLSISDGRVAGNGGGILSVAEALTLNNCVLANNFAMKGAGGAVSSPGGGALTLVGCKITGNTATTNGGGVDANGGATVTLRDCTIADNYASAQGGGVGVGSSSLDVNQSTLSGNTAAGGGGLYFAGAVGPSGLTVRNSTFSANKANGDGGAINLTSFAGTLVVRNSTLTANAASTNGGGIDVNLFGKGVVDLQSSIVQGNSAQNGPEVFTPGTASATACALGTIDGITTLSNLGGNLIGQDVKIGPLADNGGLTKTHALLPGSPCIDFGYNSGLSATDQRGMQRIVGKNSDIGSFEAQLTPPAITSIVVNDGAAQRSRVTSLTVNFSEAVAFNSSVPAAFQLVRTGPGGVSGSVNLTFAATLNSVVITFVPGGAVNPESNGSLPDGEYQLTVVGAAVSGAMTQLDGDGDGLPGGDRIELLHRLFGDADGDGDVDASDFASFRTAYGGSNAAFDVDGDGDVDTSDFGAFRIRFGQSV